MPEIAPLPPSVTPQACDRERWASRVVWVVLLMLLRSSAHECMGGPAGLGGGQWRQGEVGGKQEQGKAQ